MRWAGGTLAILFVLLAPWGGPCDRRTRPADPTTSGLSGILGPESGSQPGLHGSEYGSGIPEMALDILDDEEDDGDEFGSRNLLGPSRGFAPKAHALAGPDGRATTITTTRADRPDPPSFDVEPSARAAHPRDPRDGPSLSPHAPIPASAAGLKPAP